MKRCFVLICVLVLVPSAMAFGQSGAWVYASSEEGVQGLPGVLVGYDFGTPGAPEGYFDTTLPSPPLGQDYVSCKIHEGGIYYSAYICLLYTSPSPRDRS